jgi:type III secretory pathway component EscU
LCLLEINAVLGAVRIAFVRIVFKRHKWIIPILIATLSLGFRVKQYDEEVRKLTTCDGPPYYYKVPPSSEEAERLLKQLGG